MVKEVKEEPVVKDDFESAFDDAVQSKPFKPEEPVVEEPKVEEPKVDDPPAAEKPEDKPLDDKGTQAQDKAPEKQDQPQDPAPDNANNLLAQIQALQAQNQALQNQIQDLSNKQPTQEPPKKEQPEQPKKPELSTEDKEALTNFANEWPEVNKGVKVMVQQALAEAGIANLVQELQALKAQFGPVSQTVQQSAQQQFLSAVEAKHSDLAQIQGDLVNWVDNQPSYLKQAYNQVIDKGSVQEVVDLITRFKAETGRSKTPSPAVPKPEKAKDDRLQRLEAPTSRRTGVIDSVDPYDFDGAFAEAVAS